MKKLLALALIASTPLVTYAGKDCCPSKQSTETQESEKDTKDKECGDKDSKEGC